MPSSTHRACSLDCSLFALFQPLDWMHIFIAKYFVHNWWILLSAIALTVCRSVMWVCERKHVATGQSILTIWERYKRFTFHVIAQTICQPALNRMNVRRMYGMCGDALSASHQRRHRPPLNEMDIQTKREYANAVAVLFSSTTKLICNLLFAICIMSYVQLHPIQYIPFHSNPFILQVQRTPSYFILRADKMPSEESTMNKWILFAFIWLRSGSM